MEATFPGMLAAIGEQRLRDHMARRRLLHVPAGPGLDCSALLTMEQLGQLFAQRLVLAGALQVFAERKKLDLAVLGVREDAYVHPLAITSLAQRGVTLAVTRVDRILPHLWSLACDAERWFGDSVSVGAIASFDRASGFELHYDTVDVIAIQQEGTKLWQFHGDPEPGPGRRESRESAAIERPVAQEVLMRPGDMLFVPAGQRHRCEPLGRSLHIGVLVDHETGVTLAERLAQIAKTDVTLNEHFVPLLGAQAMEARIAAYRARLVELIEEMDAESLLAMARLRNARVRALDFGARAVEIDAPGAVAELNLSIVPDCLAGERIEVRGSNIEATPGMLAIAVALRDGPVAVAALGERLRGTLDTAALHAELRKMAAVGFVRLRSAAEPQALEPLG